MHEFSIQRNIPRYFGLALEWTDSIRVREQQIHLLQKVI